jgi:hypothetical protein
MRRESLRDESVSQATLLASPLFLSFCLLGHFECVIDFNAQISYGALEARMAQQ